MSISNSGDVPRIPHLSRQAAEAVLRSRGWLSRSHPTTSDAVLDAASLKHFLEGERIFSAADPCDGPVGVCAGEVEITLPRDDGIDVPLFRAGPGFWISGLDGFYGDAPLLNATAASAVTLLHIDPQTLRALRRAQPDMERDLFRLDHANRANLMRLLGVLTMPQSDRRVAMRLLLADELHGDDPGDWLTYPRAILADLTAVSLPTLQRVLRRFSTAGLVELGYARLRITDHDGLARVARSGSEAGETADRAGG